jgi:hypothetical protein
LLLLPAKLGDLCQPCRDWFGSLPQLRNDQGREFMATTGFLGLPVRGSASPGDYKPSTKDSRNRASTYLIL